MSSLPTTEAIHAIPSKKSLSQSLAEVRQSCGAFEQVTFAYLAWTLRATRTSTTISPTPQNSPHCTSPSPLRLPNSPDPPRARRTRLTVRASLVPAAALHFLLRRTASTSSTPSFPDWFDRWLIQFDYNLAGVHPSVWLARFANPALNDAMQFAYMTYFLYLVILPAILYAAKKSRRVLDRHDLHSHRPLLRLCNRRPLSHRKPPLRAGNAQSSPAQGGAFTATIELIEHFGRVHGAAFPSAHVAGSTVAILAARRYKPWLFWLCLPFFVGHVRRNSLWPLPLHCGCPGRPGRRRDRLGRRPYVMTRQGAQLTNET